MTTTGQIDHWRQSAGEAPRLEFKEAKAQFDSRKLHEYCVGSPFSANAISVMDADAEPFAAARAEGTADGERGGKPGTEDRGV